MSKPKFRLSLYSQPKLALRENASPEPTGMGLSGHAGFVIAPACSLYTLDEAKWLCGVFPELVPYVSDKHSKQKARK